MAEATAPTADPKTVAPKAPPKDRQPKLQMDQKVTAKVDNPHRAPGEGEDSKPSKAYGWHESIKVGDTVQQLLDKGLPQHDIRWRRDNGHITLTPPKPVEKPPAKPKADPKADPKGAAGKVATPPTK